MKMLDSDSPVVLAVDPGGTTGVAWGVVNPGGLVTVGSGEVLGGDHGFFKFFDQFVTAGYPLVTLVCETFTITASTARKTQQPDALFIIGLLRYWSAKHGVTLHMQRPGEAKGFGTNDKLKHLGWYQPTKGGHANDAVRHLVTHLARTGNDWLMSRLEEL